jgi:hypothetical protein
MLPPASAYGGFRGVGNNQFVVTQRRSSFCNDGPFRGGATTGSYDSTGVGGGRVTPITHTDPLAVRLAEVPYDGWQAEKERRVRAAYERVVENEWIDPWAEAALGPLERIHMNAVREHFAMRRDRLKTPCLPASERALMPSHAAPRPAAAASAAGPGFVASGGSDSHFDARTVAVAAEAFNARAAHPATRQQHQQQKRGKVNALTRVEWAESMEALSHLKRDTNLQTFFRGMVGRRVQKREAVAADMGFESAANAAAERAYGPDGYPPFTAFPIGSFGAASNDGELLSRGSVSVSPLPPAAIRR